MKTLSLTGGALTLRDDAFRNLWGRSDVFYRGFVVVFLVGLIAGLFSSGVELATRVLRPANEHAVTQAALRGFETSYNGPSEMRATIESYITEGVAMAFELSRLPPQAGAALRPVTRILAWLGGAVSVPLGGGFLGLLLLGGLLVHMTSRWLGGRGGIAQMLGLGALAFAPHLLDPISSLLVLAGNLSDTAAFGPIESLIGFIVFVWGLAIYVKATAVAQEFSYGRALGAILIALAVLLLVVAVAAAVVGALGAVGVLAWLTTAAR